MDGVAADRVVGFEELGGKDEFPELVLTRRLINTGCLKAKTDQEKGRMKIKGHGRRAGRDDVSDSDE